MQARAFAGYGEFVRAGGADDGSESEHGVVHLPWCMEYVYPNTIVLMARRALRLWLLSRNGVDRRSSLAFHCTFSVLHIFFFFFTRLIRFC